MLIILVAMSKAATPDRVVTVKIFLSFKIEDQRFWNFYNSFSSFFVFFLLSIKAQKIKYLSHLLINHSNFAVNRPMIFVKKNVIQPPGEPREHHLCEVQPSLG